MPQKQVEIETNSGVILTFPDFQRKGKKDGFSALSDKKPLSETDPHAKPRKNRAKSLKQTFGDLAAEVIRAQSEANQRAKQEAKQRICRPEVMQSIVKDDPDNIDLYAEAVEFLLEQCQADQPLNISQLVEAAQQHNPKLTKHLINEKIKPLMENQGVWTKKEDGKYYWIKPQETQGLKIKPSQNHKKVTPMEHLWNGYVTVTGWSPLKKRHAKQADKILKKAQQDPYKKVHKDGHIEVLSKPFKGDLSEKEKKLIRGKDAAEAEANIIGLTDQFKNIKLLRENAKFEQGIQQQVNELYAQGALKKAEIEAHQAVQRAKLKSYTPAAAVLIIILLGLLIANFQPDPINSHSTPWEQQ